MILKDIENLLDEFARLAGIKIFPFELKADKFRYVDPSADVQFDEFFNRLSDFGSYVKVVFLNNAFPYEGLKTIVKDLTFPIVVFARKPELSAILIVPYERGHVRALAFEDGIVVQKSYATFGELRENIYSLKEMISKFGLNPNWDSGKLNSSDQDAIFFLSGLPIEPIVSEKHDGIHGSSSHHKHLTPFQRVVRLFTVENKQIGYVYFFAIVVGLVNLAIPLGVQGIISLISGGLLLNSIIVLIVLVVLATGLAGWLQIIQLQIVETLQQRLFAKAAFEFSYRIPRIQLESLQRNYAPELMNRFFDVMTIQKAMPKILIDITSAVLQIIFGLLLLSFYHSMFVFFGLVLFIALVVIFYTTGPLGLKTSIQESVYKFKVVHWLEELARNLSTFKLSGFTNLPIEKMDFYLSNYLTARQSHFKILKGQMSVILFFKTIVTASLLVMGGILLTNRQINLGQFVAAEIIILLVIASVEKLIGSIDIVYDLLTAVDKIGHVTDLPLEKNDGINLKDLKDVDGLNLKLKGLKYKYEGKKDYTIKGIDLNIPSGSKICIAGHNGSGKSTLLHLISGLLHNYEGVINVNGIPLRDLNITSYRDNIGDNLSYEDIFEASLEDNITLGKQGITLDSLLWAVKKSGLTDFIDQLPNGLHTPMVAGGVNLPKYICQKIILARSIAENPKLVVIDDFVTHDRLEKKLIMEFLLNKENSWTLIIVSNDPVILSLAERVVYFKDGKILDQGDFKDLVQNEDFRQLIIGF
jgi:ABC-type bacteriocin/lantibiotic exporter with double-glycine peptidase domain